MLDREATLRRHVVARDAHDLRADRRELGVVVAEALRLRLFLQLARHLLRAIDVLAVPVQRVQVELLLDLQVPACHGVLLALVGTETCPLARLGGCAVRGAMFEHPDGAVSLSIEAQTVEE